MSDQQPAAPASEGAGWTVERAAQGGHAWIIWTADRETVVGIAYDGIDLDYDPRAVAYLWANAERLRDALTDVLADSGTGHHVHCPAQSRPSRCAGLCAKIREALAACEPPTEGGLP